MEIRATAPRNGSICTLVKKLTLTANTEAELLKLAIWFKAMREDRILVERPRDIPAPDAARTQP